MPRGTGIWLNDSLEFSTFEPKGNPMDAHAGRRKLSGDCPTIIMRNGRPWVALGTPGGHTIGQTVPQMVMNLVDFGMDVEQAIAAPRISFRRAGHAAGGGAHRRRRAARARSARATSCESSARWATPMRWRSNTTPAGECWLQRRRGSTRLGSGAEVIERRAAVRGGPAARQALTRRG